MKARYLLGLTAFGFLLASPSREAEAQAEVGAQLDLFSAYVWRGVTYTNKPVAQPDLWISFPAGSASIVSTALSVGVTSNASVRDREGLDAVMRMQRTSPGTS